MADRKNVLNDIDVSGELEPMTWRPLALSALRAFLTAFLIGAGWAFWLNRPVRGETNLIVFLRSNASMLANRNNPPREDVNSARSTTTLLLNLDPNRKRALDSAVHYFCSLGLKGHALAMRRQELYANTSTKDSDERIQISFGLSAPRRPGHPKAMIPSARRRA